MDDRSISENIVIAKFGGSSLATVDRMAASAAIVLSRPTIRLVVLSATAGTTDLLLEVARMAAQGSWKEASQLLLRLRSRHLGMAEEIGSTIVTIEKINQLCEEGERLAYGIFLLRESSSKVLDQLLSLGEQISSLLFCDSLRKLDLTAEVFDVREVLLTSANFGEAEPLVEEIALRVSKSLLPRLSSGELLVTQGFIGTTEKGEVTTLGRGGSDYTAALLGEALSSTHIEIWTDVPGISSADPRVVPTALPIDEISFAEAAELATFGAKILHPSTLWPAIRNNIPVYIGSSLAPESGGSWVAREVKNYPKVRAISLRSAQTLLTVHSLSMLGRPGFLAKVFSLLAEYGVSVDLVTTSEVSVSLTIDKPQALEKRVLDALQQFAEVKVERGLALVAIVGNRASSTAGIARLVFERVSTNIRLICHGASSHNLCFLVAEEEAEEVVRSLHQKLIVESQFSREEEELIIGGVSHA